MKRLLLVLMAIMVWYVPAKVQTIGDTGRIWSLTA